MVEKTGDRKRRRGNSTGSDGRQSPQEEVREGRKDAEDEETEAIGAEKQAATFTGSGSDLAASLNTTSFDALRIALTRLRSVTSNVNTGERLEAGDRRIQLATEFTSVDGVGGKVAASGKATRGLLEAWDLCEDGGQVTVIPLVLFCLANLLSLLGSHQPTHELGHDVISLLLPSFQSQKSAAATVEGLSPQSKFWNRLQSYLAADGAVEANGRRKEGLAASKNNAAGELTTLAAVKLMLEMTSFAGGKHARRVFDCFDWNTRSLSRLYKMRRRTATTASKGAKRLAKNPSPVSLARPDIRTLWVLLLLSFLRTPTGAPTPVSLRVAALSLGSDVLPSIFRGIDRDPPDIVIHIFRALHDGVLSQEAAAGMPRSKVVTLFSEWTCKNLVTLYEREHQTVNVATGPQGQVEKHTVADVAHHFLLALCTHPSRGICYSDNGWYGKRQSEEDEAARTIDVDMQGKSDLEQQGQGIHNKVLFGVLRSLAPTRSRKQGELAIRILAASPELFGPYLSASTGSFSSTSLEPRPDSISWLSTATFLGRVLSLPLPSFTVSAKKSDQTVRSLTKSAPPPFANVLAAILPSAITKNSLVRGITHKNILTRQASLTLLARVLQRLANFRIICLQAAEEHEETKSSKGSEDRWLAMVESVDEEDEELIAYHARPWTQCWRRLAQEARMRLPEMGSVIEALDRRSHASKASEEMNDSGSEGQGSGILFSETALRAAWLYHVVLPDAGSSTSLDIGKFATNELMRPGREPDSDGKESFDSIRWLCQLHTLHLVTADIEQGFSSLDLFARSSPSSVTLFSQFLLLCLTSTHAQVRQASYEVVEKAMRTSVLFEHNEHEWSVWMEALEGYGQDHEGTERLVKFIDECMQRCNKTPYRYIEMARRAGQEQIEQDRDLLASPFLLTIVEQLNIQTRKHLVDVTVQQEVLVFFGRLFPNLVALGSSGKRLSALLETLKEAFDDNFALQVVQVRTTFTERNQTPVLENHRSAAQEVHPFTSGKSYLELKTELRARQRPLARSELQTLAASVKDSGALRLLDELHPVLESEISQFLDIPLPPSLLAFQAAKLSADGSVSLIDWSGSSSTSALLLLSALKTAFLDGRISAPSTEVIEEVVSRGHLRSADIRRILFDDDFLQYCSRKRALSFLARIACASLSPNSFEDKTAASRLADLGIQSGEDEIMLARGLIAFLDTEQRRQWLKRATKALQRSDGYDQGDLVAFGSEIIIVDQKEGSQSSNVDDIVLKDLTSLMNAAAQSKEVQTPMLAFISMSLSKGSQGVWMAETDVADFLKAVSELVSSAQDTGDVDAVLEQLIEKSPRLASGILAVVTRSGRAGALPRTCSSALSIMRLSDEEISPTEAADLSALTLDIVKSLFRDVENARPALIQAMDDLNEIMSDESGITAAFNEVMPSAPAEAFKIDAINVLCALLSAHSAVHRDFASLKASVETLLDRGLLWLVRRFAEDDEDSPQLVASISAFTRLVGLAAEKVLIRPKRHLSEPVITAAIKRRLESPQHLRLINVLIRCTELETVSLAQYLGTILISPVLKMLRPIAEMSQEIKDMREEITELLYCIIKKSKDLCKPAAMASLVTLYGGTLSRPDRKLLEAIRISEISTGQSSLSLLRSWNAQGQTNRDESKGLDALLSLDPLRCFATCTSFPRRRAFGCKRAGFTRLDSDRYGSARIVDGSKAYDPLFVMGLFSSTLASLGSLTGWQWVSVLRTNALGVVVCCLSSLSEEVRLAATQLLARIYADVQSAHFLERGHTLVIVDAARNIMSSGDGVVPAYQPLTTTLFLAHALRCLAAPSTVLFPYTMHHLLQRPLFDSSDVPLLFNSIFSSTDHVRQERGWMLRFLRDVVQHGGSVEWDILRQRHVWDLIVSLYSAALDRSTRSMIEDVVMAMARSEATIFDVVLRGDLFGWIVQQHNTSNAGAVRRRYWIDLLEAATSTLDRVVNGPRVPDKIIVRALLAFEEAADESLVLPAGEQGAFVVAAASSTLRRLLRRLTGKSLAEVGVAEKAVCDLLDLLLRGCQEARNLLVAGERQGKEEDSIEEPNEEDILHARKGEEREATEIHRSLSQAVLDIQGATEALTSSTRQHTIMTMTQRLAVSLNNQHAKEAQIRQRLLLSSST